MNDSTLTGKALGQLGIIGQSLKKGLVEEVKKTVKVTKQQSGIETSLEQQTHTGQQADGGDHAQPPQPTTQEETKQFIAGLYGANTQNGEVGKQKADALKSLSESHTEMGPAELQKLQSLRQQLHQEAYYQPTFNRPKPKEEPVTEKLEKEKQMEMMELEEKEKKKPKNNIALDMATKSAEVHRGASG